MERVVDEDLPGLTYELVLQENTRKPTHVLFPGAIEVKVASNVASPEDFKERLRSCCLRARAAAESAFEELKVAIVERKHEWLLEVVSTLEPAEMFILPGGLPVMLPPALATTGLGSWNIEVVIRGKAGSAYDDPDGILVKIRLAGALGPDHDRHALHPLATEPTPEDDDSSSALDLQSPLSYQLGGFPISSPKLFIESTVTHVHGCKEPGPLYYYQYWKRKYSSLLDYLDVLSEHYFSATAMPGIEMVTMSGPDASPQKTPAEMWASLAAENQADYMERQRLRSITAVQPDLYLMPLGQRWAALEDTVENFLPPALKDVLRQLRLSSSSTCENVELLRRVIQVEGEGIYSFDMLTAAACAALLSEYHSFVKAAERDGRVIRRPNSMNRNGCILRDVGLEPLLLVMQRVIVRPLARLLFGIAGSELDGHHSFCVHYDNSGDADKKLDMHHDASDITVNVCLGDEGFVGAGLTFCGILGKPHHRHKSTTYSHKVGRALMHLGAHRHGADTILSGKRTNLIMWNRSSLYARCPEHYLQGDLMIRRGTYYEEAGPPDAVCISSTHDRDHEENLGSDRGFFPPTIQNNSAVTHPHPFDALKSMCPFLEESSRSEK